jgi:hypothetical protein
LLLLRLLLQVPEEGKFLKGLAVLDDIAYLGITTWSHRCRGGGLRVHCIGFRL